MSNLNALRERIVARRDLPAPALRRALREAAGLSLSDVAEVVGVSRQAIGHWEDGSRNPRSSNLKAYVDVLRLLQDGGHDAA